MFPVGAVSELTELNSEKAILTLLGERNEITLGKGKISQYFGLLQTGVEISLLENPRANNDDTITYRLRPLAR